MARQRDSGEAAAAAAVAGWMWDRLRAEGELRQADVVRYLMSRLGGRFVSETAHGGGLDYPVRRAFAALHGGRARHRARVGWGWVLDPDPPAGQPGRGGAGE